MRSFAPSPKGGAHAHAGTSYPLAFEAMPAAAATTSLSATAPGADGATVVLEIHPTSTLSEAKAIGVSTQSGVLAVLLQF